MALNITEKPLWAAVRDLETERERRQEEAEKIAEAATTLRTFVELAWHVVEPATPFVGGWHLDAICDHLQAVSEGYIRNLLINVPPRTAKSLCLGVFWPSWLWITRPETRWMFASYSAALSIRDSLKCRRLIQSPWYQRRWGHLFKMTGDTNAREKFENDKTGYRMATSVLGLGVGAGGSVLVADDPNSTQEVESEVIRQSVMDWWDQVMSTRGDDPKTVARVIVQQRLHELDLSGHVLEQGGYEHLCLPMRFEPDRRSRITATGWVDPRTEPGELLWPQRFGEPEVTELEKRLGSYGSAGQLQQRPAPEGGGMIKGHWWRYWQPRGANLKPVVVKLPDGSLEHVPPVNLPAKFDKVIQSWDMAFKDEEHSDFVVGGVVAAVGADRFILDLERGRYDLPATLNAVRKMSARWPEALAKLVEDKANGPAVIQSLRREIGGFKAVNPQGGKQSRAAAATPMVESGNWYLPHPQIAEWVPDFIAETNAFPNAAHDDQVDMFSQAASELVNIVSRPQPRILPERGHSTGERSWMA